MIDVWESAKLRARRLAHTGSGDIRPPKPLPPGEPGFGRNTVPRRRRRARPRATAERRTEKQFRFLADLHRRVERTEPTPEQLTAWNALTKSEASDLIEAYLDRC